MDFSVQCVLNDADDSGKRYLQEEREISSVL